MIEVEKLRADYDSEDAELEKIAIERLKDDDKQFIPFEEVLKQFHITQKDIDKLGDVEFE
ncbi:MAG: hypothetical protein IKZ58_08450 [Selenomonadaceae bacterium]|nr:hypothetical protein [Selenomonadaceae bacterium]